MSKFTQNHYAIMLVALAAAAYIVYAHIMATGGVVTLKSLPTAISAAVALGVTYTAIMSTSPKDIAAVASAATAVAAQGSTPTPAAKKKDGA